MTSTRTRLIEDTLEVLTASGLPGISVRNIAGVAEVNQALIFYHFKSLEGLLETACRVSVEEAVAVHRDRFSAVKTVGDLLAVGREIHSAESISGRVTVAAQVLAGARSSEVLARAGKHALDAWIDEIRPTLARVLQGTPLSGIADVEGLSRAIAASFVGLELYEGVDSVGATAALDALEGMAILADVVTDLGPLARTALHRRLRSVHKSSLTSTNTREY